jgi:hypothetical protein
MKLERWFASEASWWLDSQNPVWYWRPLEGNLNSQELCEQHDGGLLNPAVVVVVCSISSKSFSNCPIPSPIFSVLYTQVVEVITM